MWIGLAYPTNSICILENQNQKFRWEYHWNFSKADLPDNRFWSQSYQSRSSRFALDIKTFKVHGQGTWNFWNDISTCLHGNFHAYTTPSPISLPFKQTTMNHGNWFNHMEWFIFGTIDASLYGIITTCHLEQQK